MWKRILFCPAAQHEDKMRLLPNCGYHNILTRDIKELRQNLDEFIFNHYHVDYLYTIFKYRISGKNVVENGQLFDKAYGAVHFNHQNRKVDRLPSIAKHRRLRKKYQKHWLSSCQETKSTQTSGSVLADQNEHGKKSETELELIKTVDCFLECYENYTSIMVSFELKFL